VEAGGAVRQEGLGGYTDQTFWTTRACVCPTDNYVEL